MSRRSEGETRPFDEEAPLRHSSSIALGLLVSAIMVGGDSPSAAAYSDSRPQTIIGVHQDVVAHSNDYARTAIAAARDVLGAQVSRSSLRWNIVKRTRGQLDWSNADFVVGQLKNAGIEPLFVLLGSPTWANGVGTNVRNHEFYVPADQASFDRWLSEFTDFARAAARRYRDEVRLWEVWNEPNEHYYWLPEPSAARYAQVYRALRHVIHSENPEARVAVGGLAGVGAGCCISGVRFTQSLITAGIPIDAVALHPYPSNGHAPDVHVNWQDNFDDIGEVQEILNTSGQSRVEVWVTEWGWSSSAVDNQTQATYVRRSLEMLRDQFPFVAVATIFLDADRPGEYDDGLLGSDFVPKPSGVAFAAFMRERVQRGVPAGVPGVGDTSAIRTSAPANDRRSLSRSRRDAPGPILLGPSPKRPLRLVSSGFALQPETARARRPLLANMRVVRSDTHTPMLGRLTASATVLGKRLVLRRKEWHRSRVRVEWQIPAWARGRTVAGSITVRYHGATITKRFSVAVR